MSRCWTSGVTPKVNTTTYRPKKTPSDYRTKSGIQYEERSEVEIHTGRDFILDRGGFRLRLCLKCDP